METNYKVTTIRYMTDKTLSSRLTTFTFAGRYDYVSNSHINVKLCQSSLLSKSYSDQIQSQAEFVLHCVQP